jgi:hypothetical protein
MVNIITIADGKYLANMQVLLRSLVVNLPEAIIYAYVVNVAPDKIEQTKNCNKNVKVLAIDNNLAGHELECFCTNARGELLKKHYNDKDMTIWMDATTIIRKPCQGLVDFAERHDVSVRAKAEAGKHWAGLICVSATVGGKVFVERYGEIVSGDPSWYSNQDALDRCVYELAEVRFGNLSETYLDFKFKDSVIWTGKGRKVREDKRWIDEMNRWGIKWEGAGASNQPSQTSVFAYKSELKYWKKKKGRILERGAKIAEMYDRHAPGEYRCVADVGCGPRCGLFQGKTFPKMYAIDPLFDKYKKKGLAEIPEGVKTICAYADSFSISERPDIVVSFNSLDHSGNIEKSIIHIMSVTDTFLLHVHMRDASQLDEVHTMVLTEGMIDNILSRYKSVTKIVYDSDPLYDKAAPRTYVALVKNV